MMKIGIHSVQMWIVALILFAGMPVRADYDKPTITVTGQIIQGTSTAFNLLLSNSTPRAIVILGARTKFLGRQRAFGTQVTGLSGWVDAGTRFAPGECAHLITMPVNTGSIVRIGVDYDDGREQRNQFDIPPLYPKTVWTEELSTPGAKWPVVTLRPPEAQPVGGYKASHGADVRKTNKVDTILIDRI